MAVSFQREKREKLLFHTDPPITKRDVSRRNASIRARLL
jgi:hypothetical protein